MFMYYSARTERVRTYDAHNDQLMVYYIYVLLYVKEIMLLFKVSNLGE
jgi:hypothetical protein